MEPSWSKVVATSDTQYGVRFINNHVIEKWDWQDIASGFVEVLDLKDLDGSLDTNVYTSSLYTGAGTTPRGVVNFGGAGQDLHDKVCFFELADPLGSARIINMTDDEINGVGLLDQDGAPFTFGGVKSHSCAILRSSAAIRIDPVGTSAYFWIYDWALNRIKKEMSSTAGHYCLGWNDCMNEDSDSKPQWRLRSLALASSSTTTTRRDTSFGSISGWGDHTSNHNAGSLANADAPFFSESQNIFTEPLFAWSNQIIAVRKTGAEKVWRLAYHHMDPNGDISGTAAAPFKYQPLVNNDPLGELFLYTTNGMKTFGDDSAETVGESTKRTDVMLGEANRIGRRLPKWRRE
jgi:hypothetical protein